MTAKFIEEFLNTESKCDDMGISSTDPNTVLDKLESICKGNGTYEDVASIIAEMREKLKWVSSHLADYPSDLRKMLELYDTSFHIFEEEREAAQITQVQDQAKAFFNTTPPVAQQNITTNPTSANE